MLGLFDFGKKEIKHKKFRFLLVFLGLIFCVSSTIFLISVSQNLGFTVFSSSSKLFTVSISKIIANYMFFESVLVFLMGTLTLYFLSSAMMAGRVRNVGLVKVLGSMDKNGFGYLMVAPLMIMFFASIIGGVIGFSVSIMVIVGLFGYSFSSFAINGIVISLGVTVVFFLLSWVVVSSQTGKALKIVSVGLLAGDETTFDFKEEKMEFIPKFAERLSSSLSITLKSMFRSRSRSKISLMCLCISIVLITVSFVGNFVCWDTTRVYADSAFDQNVFVIGNANFVNVYQKMLDPLTDVDQKQEILATTKFTDSSYMIKREFIEQLNMVNGLVSVDKRLAVFTHVMEVRNATIEVDKFNNPQYVTYGEYRSTDCIVVGIDPDQVIQGNIFQVGTSTLGGLDNAIIGDSLAELIFQNPYKQSIKVYPDKPASGVNFNIVNVVMEPLNHGYVVYIPISELQNLFSVNEVNFILVKTDGKSNDTILEVTQLAAQYGLTVSSLDNLRNEYIASIDKLWLSILPFTLLTVVTAMLCLLNCMLVSISSRFYDFSIIKAIGAKTNYLSKIVFFECLILILATAPIGITLGTTFDLLFLLPINTISLSSILYSLTAIIGTLLGMCILCTLIVMHLKKRKQQESAFGAN